jgi:hypothetical protein
VDIGSLGTLSSCSIDVALRHPDAADWGFFTSHKKKVTTGVVAESTALINRRVTGTSERSDRGECLAGIDVAHMRNPRSVVTGVTKPYTAAIRGEIQVLSTRASLSTRSKVFATGHSLRSSWDTVEQDAIKKLLPFQHGGVCGEEPPSR